jgi:hypothetical protein
MEPAMSAAAASARTEFLANIAVPFICRSKCAAHEPLNAPVDRRVDY